MSYLDDDDSPYDLKKFVPFIVGYGLFQFGDRFITPGFSIYGMIVAVGYGVGALVASKLDTNKAIFTAIFWYNLITWIFPILGFITGSIAIVGGRKRGKKSKLYLALGAIGFGLAFANAGYAVWLRSHGMT